MRLLRYDNGAMLTQLPTSVEDLELTPHATIFHNSLSLFQFDEANYTAVDFEALGTSGRGGLKQEYLQIKPLPDK